MTIENCKILYKQWVKTLETGLKEGKPVKQKWLDKVKKNMENMAAAYPEVLDVKETKEAIEEAPLEEKEVKPNKSKRGK